MVFASTLIWYHTHTHAHTHNTHTHTHTHTHTDKHTHDTKGWADWYKHANI